VKARVVLLLGVAVVLVTLLWLGVWQVQRLGWKRDLIARVERRLTADPVAAPGPASWPGLSRPEDEYRRLRVRGQFVHELETLVHASTEFGSGYWVMTPLRCDDGFWLWVNRGFVPAEQRERAGRAASEPRGPQDVRGLLRLTEPKGSVLQSNQAVQGRWYSRDVQALADTRRLGTPAWPGPVAPYFVDAVAEPATPSAWPRAGLTVVSFPNHHLAYALTWFALAALLAGTVGHLLRSSARRRGGVETDALFRDRH